MRSRAFLATRWPWRALLHVVSTAVILLLPVCFIAVVGASMAAAFSSYDKGLRGGLATLALEVLGLVSLVVAVPAAATAVAAIDRRRARLVLGGTTAERPFSGSPAAWLAHIYLSPVGWRRVGYLVLCLVTLGPVLLMLFGLAALSAAMILTPVLVAAGEGPADVGMMTVDRFGAAAVVVCVVGLLLAIGLPYLWTSVAVVHARLGRLTSSERDDEETARRLVEVQRSRARLVDSFDAERQRIERDLHDGAQQQLVTLTMRLGMARMDAEEALGPDHPAVVEVAAAHAQAKGLMSELRSYVKGIHPKVLSDLGLGAALEQLADDAATPTSVRLGDLSQLPPHVASTAYFATAEAMTNIAKHSRASHADIVAEISDGALVVAIEDDGVGGVDATRGTGLTGMADRLAVVGGSLQVASPSGGPTLVEVRIPTPQEDP